MSDVVIVEAVRSPIGLGKPIKGALSHMRPDDLAARVVDELVRRAGLEPALIEDLILGCVTEVGEQGLNIARLVALNAGLPIEVPGMTLNRMCGSSQQAIHCAAEAILAGSADVIVAGGIESMSRVPLGSDALLPGSSGGQGPDTSVLGRPDLYSPRVLERYSLVPQGESAELMADRWSIDRATADAYALESHRRAALATERGYFAAEIVALPCSPDPAETTYLSTDQGIRRDTSLDKLAALRPVFRPDGVITAGNASQISDGAAALLLMSDLAARRLGLRARARIIGMAVVGSDPVLMLSGPITATQKVLCRCGLRLDDMDVIEINEAFATVPIAWERELHVCNMERVNPNGGAIALGHPLGASGARLMTTMLHELERRDGRYGLQTMCIGHGMGIATVIERLA